MALCVQPIFNEDLFMILSSLAWFVPVLKCPGHCTGDSRRVFLFLKFAYLYLTQSVSSGRGNHWGVVFNVRIPTTKQKFIEATKQKFIVQYESCQGPTKWSKWKYGYYLRCQAKMVKLCLIILKLKFILFKWVW